MITDKYGADLPIGAIWQKSSDSSAIIIVVGFAMVNPSIQFGKAESMGNDKNNFPATDRRINFLRTEIYNYDKYLRNPQSQDMATSAKWAIDVDDNQRELDELMYLRDFADKANKPTGIKLWQAIVLAVYTTISLVIAVVAFWMVQIR